MADPTGERYSSLTCTNLSEKSGLPRAKDATPAKVQNAGIMGDAQLSSLRLKSSTSGIVLVEVYEAV
jgi:hypothetical protein